ncbi:MAG: BamA/TamA family outer membrane protein [Prevotella sp.]|nr:BamA/TamA family outer membrane protein [Prevotella sp.]
MKAITCWLGLLPLLLTSCISTRSVPDDDQLFVGLTKISYDKDTIQWPVAFDQHLDDTKAEIEAALATAPNGALFGSSYYHSPFSWRLWVYNKYGSKQSKFARWMTKSFGKPPVLMSQVNPALRASVAQSVLLNNGYFRGSVTYETVPQQNPKKAKIAYHVHPDSLFTYDSIAYIGFPDGPHRLIDSTASQALIRRGAPFDVSTLESERTRISTLLRNNGYYFYNTGYTTFLADTVNTANRVQMRIQLADGLPDEAMRKWYIGNVNINLRRSMREQLTDSTHRGHLTIHYSGHKSPIRPRVLLKNMRLFPRRLYSYENYQETAAKINATGVFSSVDFQFTPRSYALPDSHTSASQSDTLDLQLNCTFDKPYDFYFETNFNARTIGRFGPEVKVGFTKRNAFHGGEKLDVNLHGNYEWQKSNHERMNSYQYGVDASIEFPRIVAPFYDSDRIRRTKDGRPRPHRFFSTPVTLAKVSIDKINRPDYYRMNVASGEWTYRWQSSEQSRHEFSPLTLKYQHLSSTTAAFEEMLLQNLYQAAMMDDQFIPQMRYTYTYTSPATKRNPIRWETTLSEAGNLTALYDVVVQGNRWSDTDKTLFKNPYAQFLRLETDLTKTWQLSNTSQLVGHVNAGVIRCFGNTEVDGSPFSERFYAGGANSIRAFTVRSIGPGAFNGAIDGMGSFQRQFSYILQNGDLKLIANLEYRTRLFGNLGGALFLDAGNVWQWQDPEWTTDWKLRLNSVFDQIAVGTGVGLRYDLGFLVIRIDWGLALHMPYETSRSGYFNVDSFRDAQALHFAIGYPF